MWARRLTAEHGLIRSAAPAHVETVRHRRGDVGGEYAARGVLRGGRGRQDRDFAPPPLVSLRSCPPAPRSRPSSPSCGPSCDAAASRCWTPAGWPGPSASLRRVALPGQRTGGGPSPHRRRAGVRAGRGSYGGTAGDHPGSGYVVRKRGRTGSGRRRRPALEDDLGHRSGGPYGTGSSRAWCRAALQGQAAQYGLRFGPDPSTHNRCTIGGMIGNNACGPRALGYGKTADNVVAAGGDRGRRPGPFRSGRGAGSAVGKRLHSLVAAKSGHDPARVRPRWSPGLRLQPAAPAAENRFDVARFLAGTEGTLGVVTEATVRLVADAPHKIMIALGYPTMADAGDAVAALLPRSPTAAEGLDRRNRRGGAANPRRGRGAAAGRRLDVRRARG